MYIQVVKCASIAVLLLAMFFGNSPSIYQVALTLAVTMGAILVLIQAFQAKRYWWAAAFFTVAILFNPALPAVRLSGAIGSSLVAWHPASGSESILSPGLKTSSRASPPIPSPSLPSSCRTTGFPHGPD